MPPKDEYTVGWICPISDELTAALYMLDERHDPLEAQDPGDTNIYELGSINGHNIAICCLPDGVYGTTSAAIVVAHMQRTFRNIAFAMLVGIGGGIPSAAHDIRLGDVVVSRPGAGFGGVIPHDVGELLGEKGYKITGTLNKPPSILLNAIARLAAEHNGRESRIPEFVNEMVGRYPRLRPRFSYDQSRQDVLYNEKELVDRPARPSPHPTIHYGLIASGNKLIKDRAIRDILGQTLNVLCVEMEAAGIMDECPCLVIRGISDYADPNRNDLWKGYDAAVAAAYAKELLFVVPKQSRRTREEDKGFRVPFDLTNMRTATPFVGREGEIDYLWDRLQPTSPPKQKCVVLHGLAGIGKSQLAIEFASKYKDSFSAVFWLNGNTLTTLQQSFASILHRLPGVGSEIRNSPGVEDQTEAISHSGCESLISASYDPAKFFSNADHGSILITSRNSDLMGGQEMMHPVQTLTDKEAIELLIRKAKTVLRGEHKSNLDVVALARRLGGLPLALILAGSYTRRTGIAVGKYLESYPESWSRLQGSSKSHQDYPHEDLNRALLMTYTQVEETAPSAAKLLLLLSCYHNRDIWYDLVRRGVDGGCNSGWLANITTNVLDFSDAIGELVKFSMVEVSSSGAYSLHPVVRDWCRSQLQAAREQRGKRNEQSEDEDMILITLRSISRSIPSPDAHDRWKIQQRLLPHANGLVHLLNKLCLESKDIDSMFQISYLFAEQKDFDGSRNLFSSVKSYFETALGPGHTTTIDFTFALGALYLHYDAAKAQELLYQALSHGPRGTIFPPWDIIPVLALLRIKQGRWEEAEKGLKQALTRLSAPDVPDYGRQKIELMLGFLYFNQKRYDDIEEQYRETIMGGAASSTINKQQLMMAGILGTVYILQERFEAAEELWDMALSKCERCLGAYHDGTLNTLSLLGDCYFKQAKYVEAESAFSKALTGYMHTHGPAHISTLSATLDLGRSRYQLGRNGATGLLRTTIERYHTSQGRLGRVTLKVTFRIGFLFYQKGDLTEAESMLQEAYTGLAQLLGHHDEDTMESAILLAHINAKKQRYEEAESILQQSLCSDMSQLIPFSLPRLHTLFYLAKVHHSQGEYSKARTGYEEYLAGAQGTQDMLRFAAADAIKSLDREEARLQLAPDRQDGVESSCFTRW